MSRREEPSRLLFASGLIALGLVGLSFGDFVSVLQQLPKWVPGRAAIPYAAAALMVLAGAGLLFERTAAFSTRIAFWYLGLWVLLLDLPLAIAEPLVTNSWARMAHIVVLWAGGWVLFAAVAAPTDGSAPTFAAGARGIRLAQILFGLSLPPLGLAHFVYLDLTTPLVPSWLPYHTAWAYLTGAAQIAAGLAVLFSIRARLAAALEAAMLAAFTILVWIPAIVTAPGVNRSWSGFAMSWACSAAAWVVSASYATTPSGPFGSSIARAPKG